MDSNLLNLKLTALLRSDGDGRVGTLSEDDSPWPAGVLLGQASNLLCNLLYVLGLVAVGFSEGSGLGLVTDQNVDVWEDLVKRILEKLADERSREVENEWLRVG